MNESGLITGLLLVLLGVAIGGGGAVLALVVYLCGRRHVLREKLAVQSPTTGPIVSPALLSFQQRPPIWLAVRGRNMYAVQAALELNNPKPCTWSEGIARDQNLFIAPPVNGWILVIGSGLPDPADDPDTSFRFLTDLSRKVGHIQFFAGDRTLAQHSWVRVEAGRVVRAYAWAGRTLWNQGVKTRDEIELGLKCFHYFESPERKPGASLDVLATNTEKVPLLAARWSLDPATIDERLFDQSRGIAGELPRLY